MSLRDWASRIAYRILDWADPVEEFVLLPATEDPVTKEYVDRPFSVPTAARGSVSKGPKKDRVWGKVDYLPTGTLDTGPTSAEVIESGIGILYADSDRPGFLPTGHYYFVLDGQPITVVKNLKIDEEGMMIYLSSWNRHGYRTTYKDKNG